MYSVKGDLRLIAALRESVPDVLFLGIQPSLVVFGYPILPAVEQAVVNIGSEAGRPSMLGPVWRAAAEPRVRKILHEGS
jgi:hypothetical protein